MKMKKLFIALVSLAFALAGVLRGQAPTATLVGRVTDPTSANIVGATITVINAATNETRTTKTDANGQYTVTNLDPGIYNVTIAMAGFNQLSESNFRLATEQTARLDASLRVGVTSDTVSVSASEVGLLNTETSSKGDVITPVEIAEIPLNGRDFNDLAFTVAGVQPAEQNAKGAPYVANGLRADSSGVFVDGINDENPRDAGSQISPPLDSLQEFKMETSGYTAQYGRLSGSVVTMVTKSGGNKFHGLLFEYLRNDLFDAQSYNFANINVPKNKLRKNQFGGGISGPVIIPHLYDGRDKTFFILNLESLRSVTGTNATSLVPNARERLGDFSQSGPIVNGLPTPYYLHNPNSAAKCTPPTVTTGCLNPSNPSQLKTIDPVGQKLLAYYPAPNLIVSPGNPNYALNTNSTSDWNNGPAKIDQKLGENDQFAVRFLRRYSSSTNPTSRQLRRRHLCACNAHRPL